MAEVLQDSQGQELENLEGIHLEDKGTVVSIHYRTSPDPAVARQAILEAIEEIPARWTERSRKARR